MITARVIARLRRHSLDGALAAGADPSTSVLLATRAAQLTQPLTRRRTAAALERLALAPDRVYGRFGVRPVRRAAERNCRALLELAADLRREGPRYANGIAAARMVVADGTGPAYTDRYGEGLARAVELARRQLLGIALPDQVEVPHPI